MRKRVIIIGSGFSALAASCYLAKAGFEVVIYEKNCEIGGRARQIQRDGFTFDIGPTFYWMPDVFESFFADFGKEVSDYYILEKLDPAYKVYFEESDPVPVSGSFEKIRSTFDKIEPGAGKKLDKFISIAKDNYEIAIKDLVYKPGESVLELVSVKTLKRLNLFFKSISSLVRQHFKDERLIKIMEFPALFLGAKPSKTPAFYSFMNHADFVLGTWHPKGGMYEVVRAMSSLAAELGVKIHTDSPISSIKTDNGRVLGVKVNGHLVDCDILLSGADYAHTESLMSEKYRGYSNAFWKKKTFAPSALLFYVGFDKKIKNVNHHTLFFDSDFELHAKAIYDVKAWPDNPLFYASFPSKTDDSMAPKGHESGIFLIPLPCGIEDSLVIREGYFELIMKRLEEKTGQSISSNVLFKESFCISDFVREYNSYGGNAYGLANTILQTHILRPKLKSEKLNNMYFTGQLTVPGPGVPPSIISGNIVSKLIQKYERSF